MQERKENNAKVISEEYLQLNKTYSFVYKFAIAYSDYIYKARDYGTGEYLSMMEAHVLTDIYDNPGITVSELAKIWDRTSSAISQTVRKLIKRGLAYRENSQEDAKVFFLYPTERGDEFSLAHKEYDILGINKTRKKLLEKFTKEELIAFYKILEEYTKIIKSNNQMR